MKLYLWDEVIGFEGDRSTGNRFFLWETFQYLNSLNDFRFELKLLETDYVWVKSCLVNLPNTSTYRRSEMPSDVFNLNPDMTVEELFPYFWEGEKLPLKDININLAGFGAFKITESYLVNLKLKEDSYSRKINREFIKESISYGIKSWFGNVSSLANDMLDQLLLGVLSTAEVLGLYSVSYNYSKIAIKPINGIFNVFYNKIFLAITIS